MRLRTIFGLALAGAITSLWVHNRDLRERLAAAGEPIPLSPMRQAWLALRPLTGARPVVESIPVPRALPLQIDG